MRLKFYVPLFLVAFIVASAGVARSQEQGEEEGVRGAFLTSRASVSVGVGDPSANTGSGTTARRRHRRPATGSTTGEASKGASKGTSAGPNKGRGTTKNMTSGSNKGSGRTNGASTKALASRPIALGYTLYMRDEKGEGVRVDPAHEFHNGDRVRVSLETNTDGYLYVFHTENGGDPEMIYPDARLDEGDNFIEAHVPTEIPSSQEQDERLRWFAFYGQPATERLYVVLTREPLPLVPTGNDLVNYCHAKQNQCPWRPVPEMWAQVKREASERALVTKEAVYGQAQTAREREAATRGLGLDQSAPGPSVIRMNVTSSAPFLVTALDLVHN